MTKINDRIVFEGDDINIDAVDKVRLFTALKYTIGKLMEYAYNDEAANLNGYGCLAKPRETVDKWIDEIYKIINGEK